MHAVHVFKKLMLSMASMGLVQSKVLPQGIQEPLDQMEACLYLFWCIFILISNIIMFLQILKNFENIMEIWRLWTTCARRVVNSMGQHCGWASGVHFPSVFAEIFLAYFIGMVINTSLYNLSNITMVHAFNYALFF